MMRACENEEAKARLLGWWAMKHQRLRTSRTPQAAELNVFSVYFCFCLALVYTRTIDGGGNMK
jgi:hypothetical protein